MHLIRFSDTSSRALSPCSNLQGVHNLRLSASLEQHGSFCFFFRGRGGGGRGIHFKFQNDDFPTGNSTRFPRQKTAASKYSVVAG